MPLKISIAAALIVAVTNLFGVESRNEFGVYKIHSPQTTYTSTAAREAACKEFGDGYKIPSIEELFYAPEDLRQSAESSLYASSTKNTQEGGGIYYYSFENRDVNIVPESSTLYLVCFKPHEKKEAPRRVIWGKTEQNRMSHKEAKAFCEAKGERLPSANELFSLALEKLKDEQMFVSKYGATHPKYYWSADANDDFSNTAIVVGFLRASVANSSKENRSFVRCVKDAK